MLTDAQIVEADLEVELVSALREVVAYAKEFGHTWMCLAAAEAVIAKVEHRASASEPAAPAAQQSAEAVEARFFIDHGVVHDRVTGLHVHGDMSADSYGVQRELDALNALTAIFAQDSAAQPAAQLPERDTSKPAEQQGMFRKFNVTRTDGSSAPGGKHERCEYFVLDVDHDHAAKAALTAYAMAVHSTHPVLADDMVARYRLTEQPADSAQRDELVQRLIEAAMWSNYCPEAGGYKYGRSAEDCYEELSAACEAYFGVSTETSVTQWWSEDELRAAIRRKGE
jgi:hypothetical protein